MIADDEIPAEFTSARKAMGQSIQNALEERFSDFSHTGVVSATKVFDLSKWPADWNVLKGFTDVQWLKSFCSALWHICFSFNCYSDSPLISFQTLSIDANRFSTESSLQLSVVHLLLLFSLCVCVCVCVCLFYYIIQTLKKCNCLNKFFNINI